MSWPRAMTESLRITVRHPDWWAISLAAFLVRGGIVVLALPLLALPTVASLSTETGPFLSSLLLGGAGSSDLEVLVAGLVALAVGLVLVDLAGTWLDVRLIEEAVPRIAAERSGPLDQRVMEMPVTRPPLGASLGVRTSAHVLTAAAFLFAAVRIVGAAYQELTAPSGSPTPIALRVIARAPEAVGVLVLAWVIAEAVGGLALRQQLAPGVVDSTRSAYGGAVRRLIAPRGLATLLLTDAAVFAVAILVWVASASAWTGVGDRLADAAAPPAIGLSILAFVLVWALGLVILAMTVAWRATSWTVEWLREPATSPLPVEVPIPS